MADRQNESVEQTPSCLDTADVRHFKCGHVTDRQN